MRKKWINIVLYILLIFMLFSKTTYAVGNNILDITMNGEKLQVREVPIILNGKIIKSDSPSFLYVDRTLVPARLIAENYGAKVLWDKPTETATIMHEGNLIALKINSSTARINGRKVELDKSSIPKLVNFGGSSAKTMVPLSFIADVLGYRSDWDYKEKAAYLVKKDSPGEENLADKDDSKEEKPVEKPVEKPKKASNFVRGIDLIDRDNDQVLRVNASKKVKRNIMNLDNPKRIVIDLMDSDLVGSDYYTYTYDTGNIDSVRVSQFVADSNYNKDDRIVRIVLDMKANVKTPKVKILEEDGNLIIVPDENPWDNINYNPSKKTIEIRTKNRIDYDISYDRDRNEMELSIPKEAVKLPLGRESLADRLVSEFSISENSRDYIVKVHFRRGIKYKKLSPSSGAIEIQIERDGSVKKTDRIIVLDPGHGGKDPGTIGINKANEKDVVLAVGLKVRDKLQASGYTNIVMTREIDTFPSLQARADLANRSHSDIFVSIHANSAGSSAANGIETFVPRTPSSSWKKEEGNKLASLIQEELIKETKAVNRGVKQANHFVTRNSEMAAVLIELGFMSNPSEVARLIDEDYQEQLSDAIVRGIERYFQIY